jgi:hypothetical protein
VRTLHRKERILDDDLPEIAKAYAEFRAKHPEPGQMITRLEAIRYRCFERLGVDLGGFQVIVGANGAGKTTAHCCAPPTYRGRSWKGTVAGHRAPVA